MTQEREAGQAPENESTIPQEHAARIRTLVHDMSNALEIIVQTAYLLNMGEVSDENRQWLGMLDTGVQQASGVSKALREYVLSHTTVA